MWATDIYRHGNEWWLRLLLHHIQQMLSFFFFRSVFLFTPRDALNYTAAVQRHQLHFQQRGFPGSFSGAVYIMSKVAKKCHMITSCESLVRKWGSLDHSWNIWWEAWEAWEELPLSAIFLRIQIETKTITVNKIKFKTKSCRHWFTWFFFFKKHLSNEFDKVNFAWRRVRQSLTVSANEAHFHSNDHQLQPSPAVQLFKDLCSLGRQYLSLLAMQRM